MASRGVNKVIIIGNLGADPETRYSGSGTAITSIRLATSEQWTDKQSGDKQERTEWHRVKMFGRLAEIAGEYLKKGRQVYIEGALRTEKYTDKEGIERYSTDIIANEMQMLGGGQGQDEGQHGDARQGQQGNGPSRGQGGQSQGNGGNQNRGGNQGQGNGGYQNRGGQGQGNGRFGNQNQNQNQNRGGYGANNQGGGHGGSSFEDDDIPF